MPDLNERLGSQAHYGDTSVRTMGALMEKVDTCVTRTAIYGLSRAQVRGLMAPNEGADVDHALAALCDSGRLARREVAGRDYFCENSADGLRRLDLSLRSMTY